MIPLKYLQEDIIGKTAQQALKQNTILVQIILFRTFYLVAIPYIDMCNISFNAINIIAKE
jgi:hypothetical protein